mgnify:FL=1
MTGPLDPPSAYEADDTRHPLREEWLVLQLAAYVGDDGELSDVHLCDVDGARLAALADLDPRAGEAVFALLARELHRLTAKFHALPLREQERQVAAKDAS